MAFKFCPECGAQTVPGNPFCASCGAALSVTEKTAVAPTPAKARLGGFVVLVLLLAVGGGFWGWERSRAEERSLKPGERRTNSGAIVPVATPGVQKFDLPPDIRTFIEKQAAETGRDPYESSFKEKELACLPARPVSDPGLRSPDAA